MSASGDHQQVQMGLIPVVRLGRRTLVSRAALLSMVERLEAKRRDQGQTPDAQEQGRLRVMT